MRLTVYHAKRKLWILGAFSAFYLVLVFLQGHDTFGFWHQTAEQFPSLLVALLSALILSSDTENEFAKCYGVSFTRLGFAHFLPHILYPLVIAVLAVPLYWILWHTGALHEYSLPMPDYKTLFFSLFVTFFLVSAFTLFVRVAIRNMYVTFFAFLIAFSPFYNLHQNLLLKKLPITMAKYDIWVTGLLYSEKYALTAEIWLKNRLSFLGAAVLFFVGALILLRQKNYENIR